MRVRFLPSRPRGSAFVSLALRHLGWSATRIDPLAQLAFKWDDRTWLETTRHMRWLARRVPLVNGRCTDISKTRVARLFAKSFGYPLALDPTQHRGTALRKSDENFSHDGLPMECPVDAPEPGYTYSKLVDNSQHPDGQVHDDLVFDLRTPWFRGSGIPYVLVKHKRVELRFEGGSSSGPETGPRYTLCEADQVFHRDEQERIAAFCDGMGLDVCELDVLRDRHDQRIYVVDANWTAAGPTATLSAADRKRVVASWSRAFAQCAEQLLESHRR